ncbi:MAG TPA: MarR family transcriptional regulator [Pseudolabrys sp.]|nr:MarR family transcriptional regulator [Pseudolabrys sp.]
MITATRPARDSAQEQNGSIEVLERELGQLARVLEAMQRKRNYPLDRAQYLLLQILEAQGPVSTAALAELLLLDDSTVTRQLASMEAADLIGREPNPKDKRSSLIHATRHGLAVARKMRRMRLERIAHLVEDWTAGERDKLAALMTKLNGALKRSLCEAETR